MRAIAKFAMRSPVAASVNAAMYAVCALIFAPAMVISAAVVGLATLRFGVRGGLHVLALAVLVAGVAYAVLLRQPGAALILCLAWVPIVFVGQILRKTENQGLALSICALFTAVYAAGTRLQVGDVTAYWETRLLALGEAIREQGGHFILADADVPIVAGVMHEATIVVLCLFWIGSIVLARWWQAELWNPGGFGKEFRELVIPRAVSPVAALIAVFALVGIAGKNSGGLPSDLLVVLVVLFAFQGLAVLHHRVNKIGLAKWWMFVFYAFLLLKPHRVGLLLAFVGLLDTVIDVRNLRRSIAR